ncbi:hypothetical protein [Peribacillus tepidiphilus]|nr:hypothetical protein [Peribacillus tepidiphilus]
MKDFIIDCETGIGEDVELTEEELARCKVEQLAWEQEQAKPMTLEE